MVLNDKILLISSSWLMEDNWLRHNSFLNIHNVAVSCLFKKIHKVSHPFLRWPFNFYFCQFLQLLLICTSIQWYHLALSHFLWLFLLFLLLWYITYNSTYNTIYIYIYLYIYIYIYQFPVHNWELKVNLLWLRHCLVFDFY